MQLMAAATVVLALVGILNTKTFTVEESKVRFGHFETALEATAESFGFMLQTEVNEFDTDEGERQIQKEFSILIDAGSSIKIGLSNAPLRLDKGVEYFSVEYVRAENTADFDLELFAALVNCASEHMLTPEYCRELLNEPAKRLTEQTAGFDNWMSGVVISKGVDKTFEKGWRIDYELYQDDSELLLFVSDKQKTLKRGKTDYDKGKAWTFMDKVSAGSRGRNSSCAAYRGFRREDIATAAAGKMDSADTDRIR